MPASAYDCEVIGSGAGEASGAKIGTGALGLDIAGVKVTPNGLIEHVTSRAQTGLTRCRAR